MADSDEVQEDEIDYYGVFNVRKQVTDRGGIAVRVSTHVRVVSSR